MEPTVRIPGRGIVTLRSTVQLFDVEDGPIVPDVWRKQTNVRVTSITVVTDHDHNNRVTVSGRGHFVNANGERDRRNTTGAAIDTAEALTIALEAGIVMAVDATR